MIRIDFPQGVPDECITWLEQHVGPGIFYNAHPGRFRNEYPAVTSDNCAWFYASEYKIYCDQDDKSIEAVGRTIPSITIRDGNSQAAMLFALRWT